MAHVGDIERTWHTSLSPSEATVRVADLLRAYGGRLRLQAGDFVSAEFRAGPRLLTVALAGLTFPPLILPLLLARRRDVVTAEAQRYGLGSEVVVTADGPVARRVASDLAHRLDVDPRPLAEV